MIQNCWKLQKLQRCWRAHCVQTIKDIDSKFWKQKLKTWMKNVSKFRCPYLLYFPKNKPTKSVTVGSGWASSLSQMIQPVQKRSYNFHFKFFWFVFKGSRAVWMSSRQPICQFSRLDYKSFLKNEWA